MKKAHKLAFACLFLTLLTACGPAPSASPTPQIPTMPPALTDGFLPPRPGEDPLDQWRDKRLFRDTQVVISDDALNFPVLIAEFLELDWHALYDFAFSHLPDDTQLFGSGDYRDDPDDPASGTSSGFYGYRFGGEIDDSTEASIMLTHYYSHTPNLYRYVKRPDEGLEPDPGLVQMDDAYRKENALALAHAALSEWGVPLDELELDFIARHYTTEARRGTGGYFFIGDLNDGESGYVMRLRHMFYGLPVFGMHYIDDERSDGLSFLYAGDHVHVEVDDFGVRSINLQLRRVVEVEQFDVPIMPLQAVIELQMDKLMTMERIERIELMLVPVGYDNEFADARHRLVPAWCFFDNLYGRHLIDAQTGVYISPGPDWWQKQQEGR